MSKRTSKQKQRRKEKRADRRATEKVRAAASVEKVQPASINA